MSNLDDARQMLELAEQTARKGDFASADGLLRDAARIQEAELGPFHPDLANTLNSLAIVAERTGRFGDAEAFYRRAAAIASASLPADDPIVVESRKNLEDFCRERGLEAFPSPVAPKASPIVHAPALAVPQPATSDRKRSPSSLAWVALGTIVVIAIVLSVSRPESTPEEPTSTPSPAPGPDAPSAPPVQSDIAAPAVASPPSSQAPSPNSITMATAQLCQRFSASGANWQCDPSGETPTQGPLVFYTRVRSPRDAVVVHRWYKGDVLRQAVNLTVRANTSEGFRTYSRQTVDAGAWRVEVQSADGDPLHEQRFVVR